MNRIKGFGLFWYDFIVGDDWATAVGVVLSMAVCALAVEAGYNAWWLLILGVFGALVVSILRATR
ncbi:MAG: hypothetical protein WBA46_01665 [Thermomicrobiales bacterium]